MFHHDSCRFTARTNLRRQATCWRLLKVVLVLALGTAAATAQAEQGSRRKAPAGEPLEAIEIPRLSGPKRTVSVARFGLKSDFEYSFGQSDVGGGLAAMLTTALVESGQFLVVERPDLGVVLAEQQLTASGVVKTEGQAQVGQLLGTQWILVGDVTEFAETGGGGLSIGLGRRSSKGIGIGPQKRTATVGMDIRVLDSSSGQVVASFAVRESVTSRALAGNLRLKGVDLANHGFERTSLGQASRRAIQRVVQRLAAAIGDKPWEGRVVDVEGEEITINAGRAAGISPGDQFAIYRLGKTLTDPVTGQVLGQRKQKIGHMVVTVVEEGFAFAKTEEPLDLGAQRGDLVLDR